MPHRRQGGPRHPVEDDLDRLIVFHGTSKEISNTAELKELVALGHACLSFMLASDACTEEYEALAEEHLQRLLGRWNDLPESLREELAEAYQAMKGNLQRLSEHVGTLNESTVRFAGAIGAAIQRFDPDGGTTNSH